MFNNINAIIFARNTSSRLPGKVLMEIDGTTIIGICVKKLEQLEGLNVIVATSREVSDDPIADWCEQNNVKYYRGSLHNVAERTVGCIKQYPCKAFFRVNADSPFLQPEIYTDAAEALYAGDGVDMVTNVQKRSYPYGIAVELVNADVFLKAAEGFSAEESEHITKHFYDHSSDYKIVNLVHHADCSQLRFVLDTPEDWAEILLLHKENKNIFNLNLTDLINIKIK